MFKLLFFQSKWNTCISSYYHCCFHKTYCIWTTSRLSAGFDIKKKINIVLLCTFCKFHRCCNIGYDGYPFTNEKYIYRYLLMIFKFIAWCSVGLLWNKASNLLIRQIDQDLWRQRGTTDPCYWTQRVSIVELSDT